jgi:hypothetical protein
MSTRVRQLPLAAHPAWRACQSVPCRAAQDPDGAGGWPAIAGAVLLTGWLVACLTIYRFILFFTTFYAT